MSFGPPRSTITDSSIAQQSALQNLIRDGLRSNREAVVRGNWEIGGPIWIDLPGCVTFVDAVITPSVAWNPIDPVLGVTGTDVTLEGELTFEERGYYRTLNNATSQTMLCTNLSRFDFSQLHVVFRDTGIATDITSLYPQRAVIEAFAGDTLENLFDATGNPSGPDVFFVALDALDDVYPADQYRAVIGPCEYGQVGWFEHVRDSSTKRATAQRYGSNYSHDRAYSAFTNHCRDITIKRATARGQYDLNIFQMHGTGTRGIRFDLVEARGAKTLAVVHFDKGASRCHVARVEIEDTGKTPIYVGDNTKRFAAVLDTGLNTGNSVNADNSVGVIYGRGSVSAGETDPYESWYSCQYASNPRVEVIDVEDMNSHLYGCAVLVDTQCDHLRIGTVRGRRLANAVLTNANSSIGDVSIEHIDYEASAAGSAINCTVTGASGRVQIGDGRIVATGAMGGAPVVASDADLAHFDVGAVQISGGTGGYGIATYCPTALNGTIITGQSVGILASGAAAVVTCTGVDASGCTTEQSTASSGVVQGNAFRAKGTITCVTVANLVDSDYMTILDGLGNSKLYEFDKAGDGVTGGRVQVNVSTDTTAAQVATRLRTAILANQPVFDVVDNANGTLTVKHKLYGSVGNATMTENVANAGFLVSGLSGGA